jgi:hypothetical protein
MIVRRIWIAALAAMAFAAAPLGAASFVFTTGNADGRLAALSQPPAGSTLETETADDFLLGETTSITGATITGLITSGASAADISNVEIEIYRVFPNDSLPPSGRVPSRANSPADVEIDRATRDGRSGTLAFRAAVLSDHFTLQNTVVTGIHTAPANVTHGEGPVTGVEVQITVAFDPPIVLPADSYFFRPEVSVNGADFLFVSAPRPIVSPGTPFLPDRQAWIRNSALKPDWLRIGTDIIDGTPAPTFNMAFSLEGETIPGAGTPAQPECHGETVSSVARQFGGMKAAAAALGFSSVSSLQEGLRQYCGR